MSVKIQACTACGKPTPLHLLDAKPSRLRTGETIDDAAWRNANFDRLECRECYGPGWAEGRA